MLYKQITSQINFNTFSELRAKFKYKSKLDYKNIIFSSQNFINTNPKLFWKLFCQQK